MQIYLAGIETCPDYLPEIKPRYILTTYYCMQSQKKTAAKIMNYVNSGDCGGFLLDSGAFTFFSSGEQKSEAEWLKYADSFAEFIVNNRIKRYFELDIDALVEIDFVEKIRRRIETATGVQSIPVWHIERGWEYFEKMCDEYEYVAIGGLVHHPKLKQIEAIMPRFINHAHKKGCRIHGLGYTSLEKAKNFGFDSVDSTSWSAGGRYGQLYTIKGNAIKGKTIKIEGKRLDSKKAHRHNMEIWARYAKLIDKNL